MLRALTLLLCCSQAAAAVEPPAEAEQAPFDVLELRVLGNTVLSSAQIETALYPYVGENKTFKDLEAARLALETTYKDAGYGTVFVDIPEQAIQDDGVVRLRVTQGRLDRVRISGARYFSNGALRAELPALKSGEVPSLPQLQAELEAVNRQARDRSITPVLKAGRTPGTVDVELKVQDELPLHGVLDINDRYTADTSRTRASLNLSYDNLWQRFHSLSLQYQTSPEATDEARVIAATYVAPVTDTGHMIAAYAVDTNSDVATIGTLSVLGAGRIYGVRYILPLPPRGELFHNLSFGADYKDFSETILLTDGVRDDTPIAYTTWSLAYGGTRRTDTSAIGFNLSTNFGFRGVTNEEPEFEYKRYLARPNYFYLRGSAQYEHAAWWNTRWYVRAAGQYAIEPLISNEQLSIGGAESVRGYLESETLGDLGVSASLEWRAPALLRWLPFVSPESYAFAFVDGGVVAVVDALPDQATRVELSSVGLGLRIAAFDGLQAALDGAYTLQDSDRTDAHDTRLHFQLSYGF